MVKLQVASGPGSLEHVWVNPDRVIAVQEVRGPARHNSCTLILDGGTHNRFTVTGTAEDTIAALSIIGTKEK